jgi:hypothetical protein
MLLKLLEGRAIRAYLTFLQKARVSEPHNVFAIIERLPSQRTCPILRRSKVTLLAGNYFIAQYAVVATEINFNSSTIESTALF